MLTQEEIELEIQRIHDEASRAGYEEMDDDDITVVTDVLEWVLGNKDKPQPHTTMF